LGPWPENSAEDCRRPCTGHRTSQPGVNFQWLPV
jgi:hypothetical protein